MSPPPTGPASLSVPSSNSPAPRFLSPRPAPSRLPGSSSPHHPGLAGGYPMAQSRSWGTPTSDVRGTSPTMGARDGEPDDEVGTDPPEAAKLGDAADAAKANIFAASAGAVEPRPVPGYPLGATRCYWSVLDDELRFLYIDPILQNHMGIENTRLLGTSIYDYIHPEERQQAMIDLEKSANHHPGQPASKAMEAKGSGASGVSSQASSSGAASPAGGQSPARRRWEYGGVTRCRFARSSHIRKMLGAESPAVDPEAHKYSLDDEYLSLKMVMSSIGINLVLCFFHAAFDKDPVADNREAEPRSTWTNWCGPNVPDPTDSYFSPDQAARLEAALLTAQRAANVSDAVDPAGASKPPAHVFQVLKSTTGDILFSYPPSRPDSESKEEQRPRYIPDEYAALAMDVCRRPKETNVAAKTNCTRRLKSRHPVMKDGNLMSIESVVIQYGSVIFAFFSTGGAFPSRSGGTTRPGDPLAAPGGRKRIRTSSSQVQPQHHQNAFQQHQNQVTQNLLNDPTTLQTLVTMPWAHDSFAGAPSAASPALGSGDLSPTLASAASVLGSFQNAAYSPAMQTVGLPEDIEVPSSSSTNQAPTSAQQGDYGSYNLQHLAAMAMGEIGVTSADPIDPITSGAERSASPAPPPPPRAPRSKPPPANTNMPPPGSERIPHVRQQRAHAHSASVDLAAQSLLGIGQGFEFANSGQRGGSGGRGRGSESRSPQPGGDDAFAEFNGPAVNAQGLKACSSCGTTNSPEWRKGPSGVKSLCNACGLRFSRAQARKLKLAKAAEAKKNGLPPPAPPPKQPKKPKAPKGAGRGAAADPSGGVGGAPGPSSHSMGGGPSASSSMVDSIPVPASTSPNMYDYGGGSESNVPWATDPSESPGADDGVGGGSYMVGV